MTYVEDGFEDGKSVAVVHVGRVHGAFDALGALFFRRLYYQKVAQLFHVFLQMTPYDKTRRLKGKTLISTSKTVVSATGRIVQP